MRIERIRNQDKEDKEAVQRESGSYISSQLASEFGREG